MIGLNKLYDTLRTTGVAKQKREEVERCLKKDRNKKGIYLS
jgi:hypothetical protein